MARIPRGSDVLLSVRVDHNLNNEIEEYLVVKQERFSHKPKLKKHDAVRDFVEKGRQECNMLVGIWKTEIENFKNDSDGRN